jgi:hypothetical protein
MHGDSTLRSGHPAGHPLDAASTERLRRAAGAAHELSNLLWEALHDELRPRSGSGPRVLRVAELSEQLVDIASTVSTLGVAVARDADPPVADPRVAERSVADRSVADTDAPGTPASSVAFGQPFASEPPFSGGQPPAGGQPFAPAPFSRVERPFEYAGGPSSAVVIIDERDDPVSAVAAAVTSEAPQRSQSQPQIRPRPLPWDTPLTDELRVTRSRERPNEPA